MDKDFLNKSSLVLSESKEKDLPKGEYEIENPSLAEVKDGKVIAKKEGKTIIKVKNGEAVKTVALKVTKNKKVFAVFGAIHNFVAGSFVRAAVSIGVAAAVVATAIAVPVAVSAGKGDKPVDPPEPVVVPVSGVTLNETSKTIKYESGQLVATVAPADATNKNVSWSVDHPEVLSVDASTGAYQGLSNGNAVLTVTTEDGGYTASCNFTVFQAPPVESVTLNKKSVEMHIGESVALSAKALPEAAEQEFTWESSNTDAVTVSDKGEILSVAQGTAVITVKAKSDETKYDTCSVTVDHIVRIAPLSFTNNSEYKADVEFKAGSTEIVYASSPNGPYFAAINEFCAILKPNESIYFKAATTGSAHPCEFTVTSDSDVEGEEASVEVGGNIQSLIYGDLVEDTVDLLEVIPGSSEHGAFHLLFVGSSALTYVPTNFLPMTKLSSKCYETMFSDCTRLQNLPALPATEISDYCYYAMFYNSGISEIPEGYLPAMEMKDFCYCIMFAYCKNLTKVPENLLPATTLADSCYREMFEASAIKSLPKLPANDLQFCCYYSMFERCDNLMEIPEGYLNATEIADRSYQRMFYECKNLTKLPENLLPGESPKVYSYAKMFSKCTSLTVLPNKIMSATSLGVYTCWAMFAECTGLIEIPSTFMPSVEQTDYASCYEMFTSCTSLKTIGRDLLIGAKLSNWCYRSMFKDCTSLTSVCQLVDLDSSISIDIDSPYDEMFMNCSSLKVNKVGGTKIFSFLDIEGPCVYYCENMFKGTKDQSDDLKFEHGETVYF